MRPTRRSLPSPLVLKYYGYQATVTFGFFWPIFTLFLLHRDLSYAQIGALGSISAAMTVVGEIPTGYAADRIGRRNALAVGSGLLATSVLGFVAAETFAAFAFLYFLWALGLGFQSGTGDAWLYDALERRLRAEEFTRVRGRGGSVGRVVSAGSMLASGALYAIDPRLPFLVGGLLVAASLPIVLSFPRSAPEAAGDAAEGSANQADDAPSRRVVRTAVTVRDALLGPQLRWVVLYLAVFFGVVHSADAFVQPIAVRTLDLPTAGLGPLYAGFSLVAAVGSYYADEIRWALTTRWTFVLVPGATAAFFVAPAVAPVAAFPAFFAMKTANAVVRPVASGYVNDRVGSRDRATLLSGAAMVYALVRLPLRPATGWLADATTPIATVAAMGVALGLCAVAVSAVGAVAESGRRSVADGPDG